MPMTRSLRYALLVLLATALPRPAVAQTARDSVLATVQAFFHAMTASDSAGSVAVMRPDGQYYAVRQAQDSTVVRRMAHAQ